MATIGQINANKSKTGTWTSNSGKVYTSNKTSKTSGSSSSSSSKSSGSGVTGPDGKDFADTLRSIGINVTNEQVSNAAKTVSSGGGSTTTKPAPVVTPTTTTKTSTYAGPSIVDYLASTGQASDYNTRAKMAAAQGITNYTGTAAQNTQLLNTLRSGSTGATSTVNTTTPTGALPGVSEMSQADFVKKLTEMGITSSVPVREEIPKEPLPKPLVAQTYDEFRDEISQYSPKAPETPQVADIYTEQRQKLGISALEDEINGYDAQKAELLAEMDNFKRQENVGQSASFAAGRVSAGAQNVQDKIDALERSQSIAINKLNTKNTFLENLIKFTQSDYATANSNYQFEFNKNLQLQQMFSNKQDKAVDDARATLTTFNNILSTSGMSYDDMSASMKAQINVQEMQAKMPIGTMELYARSKPKSDIVSTQSGTDASGNDFVTFFSKDADGNVTQEKMYTGGVSKTGSSEKTKTEQANDIAEAVLRFKDTMEAKGWMGANPEEYRYYRDYIQTTYGSAAVLLLNKAMEDAGISVDNENK
jgi:hypothetical protein